MKLTVSTARKMNKGDWKVVVNVTSGTTTLFVSTDGEPFLAIPNGAFTALDMPIITFGKGDRIKYEETGVSTVNINKA